MAIIPPTMTKGDEVFAAYMGPYREKNGEHRMTLTIHSAATGRMIAHAEILVATRDSGIALGDAIREVVTREVPPPLHSVNNDFEGHN
jgi:hypothetical protein